MTPTIGVIKKTMARVGLLLYHPNINSLDWFTTSNPHLGVHNDFKYYHEVLHSNQCFVLRNITLKAYV